jgi:malonyl-CoA/methylmalonyl-CoA synthetase
MIIYDEGRHTAEAVFARADAIAKGLSCDPPSGGPSGGPSGRERVGVLAPPGAAFVSALFGVWRAGGCAVVLSTLHPPAETSFFCEDAGVRALVVHPTLRDRVEHVASGRRIVSTEAEGGAAFDPTFDADADALQLYTSGTTGKPKGAVLLQGNLATQQRLLGDAWGFSANDVLLHVLPLHHMHGLCIALLTAVGARASVRMMAFDARRVWDAMSESTVFMAVPTIYAKLLAAFDEADAATGARWEAGARGLRLATSGSAALPVTLGERWRALSGAYPLERFGMTEIGVGASNPLASEARRPGTVGLPLPTVETRVVDGELQVAGPSVFSRYHGREEATRDAFVVEAGTRWFKTGDTVSVDEDGYLRILGRTSVDILKSGGYKLSALEIEEALRESPAVAEVAVVGVPDETWGDRVVACVVPRPGREDECAPDALRAFARERLAPYKVPREFVLRRDLPRNAMGKVIKPELAKMVSAISR